MSREITDGPFLASDGLWTHMGHAILMFQKRWGTPSWVGISLPVTTSRMALDRIQVGCCGFPVARKSYYEHFGLVEIQQTFYHLPEISTAARWRAEAPQGFRFTMKAWQLITHEPTSPTYRRLRRKIPEADQERYGAFRPTGEVRRAWLDTLAFAEEVGAMVVVFQCPASFTPTDEHVSNLRRFFRWAPRGKRVFVWEPRGNWPQDLILELCRELDLVHCVDPFRSVPLWSPGLSYWRLHGIGGWRHQYREEELEDLFQRASSMKVMTYCLFNNATSYQDALRFQERVRHRQQ